MMQFKRIAIGRRVTLGFSLVVTIVVALGVMSVLELRTIRVKSDQIIRQELPKMMTLGEIETTIKANYINTLQHIDTTSAEGMATIEKEMKAATARLTELYKTVEPDASAVDEVAIMDAIKPARASYRELREKVLKLSREGKKDAATEAAQKELDPVFKQYTQAVLKAVSFHDERGSQAAAESMRAVTMSEWVIRIGVGTAVLFSAVIAFLIGRSTRRDLSHAAQELAVSSEAVNAAAEHVNRASQTLAKGATDQAATLEETSASLEEISSMTSRNAEAAGRANQIASQTRSAAEGGAEDMNAMMAAMDQIKASSDNIAKIIKTIDEIAFQTNLLALNAAVEAARAGEAGAGFAVVAEEVRALAQRSAQAAKDTAEKIDDSIKKSEHGVQLSQKVSESLGSIVQRAREVDVLITEIARASSEQAQGVTQVVKAVNQIDTVTQANAATAEESAAAAEELNSQVIAMDELVSTVKHLAGIKAAQGATDASAPAEPAPAEPAREYVHH